MNKKMKSMITLAILTGYTMGTNALASDTAKNEEKSETETSSQKNGCEGKDKDGCNGKEKDSCKGKMKNSCKGKMGKKDKKKQQSCGGKDGCGAKNDAKKAEKEEAKDQE